MNETGNYQPYSYFQLMEVSLRELLVEKGIVTEAQVADEVEAMRKRSPAIGARVVAKAWADAAFSAMHAFRGMSYPSDIRQPILMLAASNDTIVSTAAIEEFAYHLRAGSHLVIAGAKHEILQEQDQYRNQFWAAFDAFVPGTPLY